MLKMSVKPTTVLIKSCKTGSCPVGKGLNGNAESGKHVVRIKLEENNVVVGDPCSVRISIRSGTDEDNNNMIFKGGEYLCHLKGDSHSPASEAADSGTCSDLDGTTPPPNHRHRTLVHSDDDDISSDSLSDIDRRSPPGFLPFHINERDFEKHTPPVKLNDFQGQIYALGGEGTIKSSRGTIRGVKNRVRASIATFLHLDTNKTWQEKEKGTLVVYTTTMGVIRATYLRCLKARHILRTNMIKYTEKDVFMSKSFQNELKERLGTDHVTLPQIFLEGSHLGDVEVLEKMNETGELRSILQPYRSKEACSTCDVCGDFRLLPCNVCNGSKKSVHRNQFSTELVSLKCMHCDEAGLIKCYAC